MSNSSVSYISTRKPEEFTDSNRLVNNKDTRLNAMGYRTLHKKQQTLRIGLLSTPVLLLQWYSSMWHKKWVNYNVGQNLSQRAEGTYR